MTREDAYVVVQRNAMQVWEDIQNAVDGPTFKERIERDPDVERLMAEGALSQQRLDEIFDPRAFLTRIAVVFDRLETLEF